MERGVEGGERSSGDVKFFWSFLGVPQLFTRSFNQRAQRAHRHVPLVPLSPPHTPAEGFGTKEKKPDKQEVLSDVVGCDLRACLPSTRRGRLLTVWTTPPHTTRHVARVGCVWGAFAGCPRHGRKNVLWRRGGGTDDCEACARVMSSRLRNANKRKWKQGRM